MSLDVYLYGPAESTACECRCDCGERHTHDHMLKPTLFSANGSLPDVWVAFAAHDPGTADLARKMVAALEAAGIDWKAERR